MSFTEIQASLFNFSFLATNLKSVSIDEDPSDSDETDDSEDEHTDMCCMQSSTTMRYVVSTPGG